MAEFIIMSKGLEHTILVDSDILIELQNWTTTLKQKGYVQIRRDGETGYLHRYIMSAPDHLQVDHINGNTLDNRRINLRIVTNSMNQLNKNNKIRVDNFSTGVRNIYTIGSKFRVVFKGKDYGRYSTMAEAEIKLLEVKIAAGIETPIK